MKTAIALLWLLFLTAAMAAAQTAPHSNFASASGAQSAAATEHSSSTTSSDDLRGCLSGKKGDYTLTDHQGEQHRVVGDNHLLWDDVGHEVDLTGKPANNGTFQETQIMNIDSRCWNFSLK
jgi:hypothetical protein